MKLTCRKIRPGEYVYVYIFFLTENVNPWIWFEVILFCLLYHRIWKSFFETHVILIYMSSFLFYVWPHEWVFFSHFSGGPLMSILGDTDGLRCLLDNIAKWNFFRNMVFLMDYCSTGIPREEYSLYIKIYRKICFIINAR